MGSSTMETALITLIIIPLLAAQGQNGFGDYQEQPQQNYPQYSNQDFGYPEYPDQNEIFNQYGPVDPGIYTNEGKEGGGGPEYMPPNYYNEPVVQQNPQESEWYVPQGAIPQGFELEENLGKEDTVQQQPVNFPQPPVWMNGVDENQPILYDWADYSPNGFSDYQEQPQPVYDPLPDQEFNPPQYPDEKEIYNQYGPGPVPIAGIEPIDGYESSFYDYNNFYGGPCPEEPPQYDDCGSNSDGQGIPYCDELTCTKSCNQYMNLKKGRCLENECFCENDNDVVEPTVKPNPATTPKPSLNPDDDWDYIRQDEWPSKFPNCGLPQQSPINLTPKELRDLTKKVYLANYEKPIGLIVENTGHGVRIYVQAKEVPSLILTGVTQNDDSSLDGTFTLAYIDLHWATSEHNVAGQNPADLEMQLHHFDLSFDSFENAIKVPGATISLSLLFKISPNATDVCKSVIKATENLPIGGSGTSLMNMAHLKFILDKMEKTTSYYTYSGRETQPPCNQVNWMIPKMTFDVTQNQIDELKKLKDVHGQNMLNNVRNVQNSS